MSIKQRMSKIYYKKLSSNFLAYAQQRLVSQTEIHKYCTNCGHYSNSG